LGAVRLIGELDRAALRRLRRLDGGTLLRDIPYGEGQPMQRAQRLPINEVQAAMDRGTLQSQLELRIRPDLGSLHFVSFFRDWSVEETVALVAVHHIITDFWSWLCWHRDRDALCAEKRMSIHPPLRNSYTDCILA
jgi:hypothetical protein